MTPIVLSAEFAHETNTFSRNPTGMEHFRVRSGLMEGAAAVAARGQANTELAGFMDVARERGWELVHVISASANPGGRVTDEVFEFVAGAIVAAARQHKDRLSGIALGLHGAMVTASHEDGEGELLARLRAVVGPDLPIAVTLDLHANVTPAMCRLAQIVVSYRTYPHVDMRETGARAGRILDRAMRGEIHPRTLRVERPMLDEASGGRTDRGPMLRWLEMIRAREAQDADLFAVSINAAFPHADIHDVGPTVLMTCQGDAARHLPFAEGIADEIWAGRGQKPERFHTVAEAAAMAAAFDASQGPIVIADFSDNPGGGAYGDATALLDAMLKAGVQQACFGPMVDPQLAAELHRRQVGDTVDMLMGGKTEPALGGGPLQLRGELLRLSDGTYTGDGPMIGGQTRTWGPTAVVRVAGIDILVVTNNAQMWDQQQFKAFGIEPAAMRVVALKSAQHFRAAFAPIAGKIILCDSGALCAPGVKSLPFRHVRRPLYPLDAELDIEAWKRARDPARIDPAGAAGSRPDGA